MLVHGVGVYIFLADEDVSIGSSWTCDIILRAVDFAWQVFQKKGEAFPGTLVCQADNTTREAKNSTLSKMCASLVAANYFQTAAHFHLRVGHTHEDIGGLAMFPYFSFRTTVNSQPLTGGASAQ